MASERIPQVGASDIERVLARDFAVAEIEMAISILAEYGERSSKPGTNRVRMAALKLAAGNIERLRQLVELAEADYRDVLGPAEYPEAIRLSANAADSDERRRVEEADWQQYQEWLRRP